MNARRADWRDSHIGDQLQPKRKYPTQEAAQAARQAMEHKYPIYAFSVYDCRWEDRFEYGQTALLHWHVGRKRITRGT